MTVSPVFLTLVVILAVICTVSADCYFCTGSCCGTGSNRYCCDSYYYTDYYYVYSSVYVLSTGAIVGAVIGSLAGVAIFIAVIVVICRVCCGVARSAQQGTIMMNHQPQGIAVIQTSAATTQQQAGMTNPPKHGGNINNGFHP